MSEECYPFVFSTGLQEVLICTATGAQEQQREFFEQLQAVQQPVLTVNDIAREQIKEAVDAVDEAQKI